MGRATRRQRERALAKARRMANQAIAELEASPGSHEKRVRAEAFVATVALMEQAMKADA